MADDENESEEENEAAEKKKSESLFGKLISAAKRQSRASRRKFTMCKAPHWHQSVCALQAGSRKLTGLGNQPGQRASR